MYVGREFADASNQYCQQGVVQPDSGTVQWGWRSSALPGGVMGSVITADGTVFVITIQGAYAYRLTDGRQLRHALPKDHLSVMAYGTV